MMCRDQEFYSHRESKEVRKTTRARSDERAKSGDEGNARLLDKIFRQHQYSIQS